MLIVILSTFLEVIKCELKHQHIGILYNTHKEGEYLLLNVSLLFYFIFYMRLQGVEGNPKVKVLKTEDQERTYLTEKTWWGETPKLKNIDSYLLEAEKKT